MRKIKECMHDSVEPFEDGMLSIALAGFLENISTLLVMDAGQRMMQDHPELTIGQEKHGGKGKGDSPITMGDIITVMHGEDLIRHTGQFTQLQGFISWFLNQNEPDDDIWYDMNFLVDKWNQYAEIKKG